MVQELAKNIISTSLLVSRPKICIIRILSYIRMSTQKRDVFIANTMKITFNCVSISHCITEAHDMLGVYFENLANYPCC